MNRSIIAIIITTLLICATICCAQDAPEDGLRFHLSFNKRDVVADYAQGNPQSTSFTESLELRGVEGVSGTPGFQIAADERLDYELADNFALTSGSVSMWVKPVNWEGRNDRFEVFFHARSPQYVMHFYKYSQPNHLYLYVNVGGVNTVARTSAEHWKPGDWHHIGASWQPGELRLYMDGELKHAKALEPPMDFPEASEGLITITPPQLWAKGFDVNDRTVADEVKIWDRVLDDAEMRREYVTHAPADADAEPLDVRWEIDPTPGSVLLEIDAFRLMAADDGGEELTIRAALLDADGAEIAQENAQTEQGGASIELPFGELAPGEYTVSVAAIGVDGAEKASVSSSFTRPVVTWADAPTFEGVVPEPWTPIERDGAALGVWGRGHEFGAGPLPTAISSQERAVLAGPAKLMVNSREPAWSGGEVASEAPDAVEREGTGRAGEVALEWRTRMEYDGMLRCDLTVSPVGERAEVRSLALELPVAAEQGAYALAPTMVAWEDGRIDLPWRDMVWLTGREAGVCWFTESKANWVIPDDTTPIAIERGEDATTLTLTMIGEPVTIDGPVSYTFGLQATPTRPLPEGWRNLNLGNPNQVEGQRAMLVCQGGGAFLRNAYLLPDPELDLNDALERWKDWGRTLPYSTPTFLADHTPEWDFYQREWQHSERHIYVGYKTREGTEYALRATCPRSDFSELMVHWMDDLLRDYPAIGGVYYDCCDASECRNTEHGCGGVDAFGKPYASRPIFALRDVLRRVMTIAHSHNDIVMNHAHSRFYPPIHGFSDYWFPGEQYTTRLGEDIWYYTDQIPPEVWQIELNSQVRGVGISFLPEFGRGTEKRYQFEDPAPSRALLAACLLHDVPSSGFYIYADEINAVWAIYDKYQLSDATFHGYWEADCPVSVDEPLQASVYVAQDADVIVVSNLTPEAATGTVRMGEMEQAVSVGARDFVVIEVERDE